MRVLAKLWLLLGVVLGIVGPAQAQPALGEALKDIPVADHWIYDDLPRAVAEAKRTGKPLLVVLRCIPCPPGKTLDEAVMQPTAELAKLEQRFVCVRVIKTNGLDLDVFQYDYDMSWNAMFMNADMTIYGRYGTRTASGHDSDKNLSIAAFAKAAERALELHVGYPTNQSLLQAKTGKPVRWKKPEEIPGLTDRQGVAVTRKNCIHCHMVKDYALRAKWQEGKLDETDLFVYPAPERIGLTLDLDDGLIVKEVQPKSPAEAAGIKVGDRLQQAGQQPLVSTADLTWVLHTAPPGNTTVAIDVERDGKPTKTMVLALRGDWKRSDIAWRASSWYGLRQGLKVEPLSAEQKEKHGLAADALALEIKGLFGKSTSHFQKVDIRKGDVIIAVDGSKRALDESEFLVLLRTKHGPDDILKLTMLRGDQSREVAMQLW